MYTILFEDEFMTEKEPGLGRFIGAEEDLAKGEEDIKGGDDDYEEGKRIVVGMERETRADRRDGGADGVVLSLTSKGDGFYEVYVYFWVYTERWDRMLIVVIIHFWVIGFTLST